MRVLISTIAAVLAVSILCFASTASADIGSTLGEIEWGDSPDEVVQKLRTAKLQALREDSRLRNDRPAMQRARQDVLDQVRRIEDSHTELRGDETDYDVSVVGTEFTKNNNEAMIRVRDNTAQRFYFFIDNHFYKLVIAYYQEQVENVGFSAFIERVRQQYGEPATTEYGTVRGEEGLVEAIWQDSESKLRVNDRRGFFGTYTMTFSDREFIERWDERGRKFGGRGEEEQDHVVSDRVRSLTQPSATQRRSPVEDMVGEVEIDLGSDEEEEEEEKEETTASSPAASEPSSAPSEPREQPSSRPQPAADDDDDDDDLVIY